MKTVVVLALGLCLLGCGRQGPAIGAPAPDDFESITLRVSSQNFYDANIVLFISGSARRRLGTVRSNTTESFTIRWEPNVLAIGVDFVPGASLITNEMNVNPGETLDLALPPNAHRGTVPLRLRRPGG